nr:BldC family transcriptional regulator [Allonocardiopsis opalescens]
MTAQEVANLFRVHPKTVSSWARQGKLTYIRTLGGHRRYTADDVRQLLKEQTTDDEPDPTEPGDRDEPAP